MIVAITNDGYIKKTPKKEFEVGSVRTKGVYKKYYEGGIRTIREVSMYDTLLLYTEKGQCFRFEVENIPATNICEKGLLLNEIFAVGDKFCSILSVKYLLNSSEINDYFVLIMTTKGMIVKQKLSDYRGINDGIYTISLDEEDVIADVMLLAKGNDYIFNCMIDGVGKTFNCEYDSIRITSLKSRSKGVICGILRNPKSAMVCMDATNEKTGYLIISHKGCCKRTLSDDSRTMSRKSSGCVLMRLQEEDYVVFNMFVNANDDILVVTNNGYTKRLNVGSLNEVHRGSRATSCIRLYDGDGVVACCRISPAKKIILDNDKIEFFVHDTEKSQKILSSIYDIDDDFDKTINIQSDDKMLLILKSLLTQERWHYPEVEELCKKHNVMMGSILEQINDYAFEKIENLVIDDDGEFIYVSTDYKNKLI